MDPCNGYIYLAVSEKGIYRCDMDGASFTKLISHFDDASLPQPKGLTLDRDTNSWVGCLCVCLSVCVFVCLFVCVCLTYVYLSVIFVRPVLINCSQNERLPFWASVAKSGLPVSFYMIVLSETFHLLQRSSKLNLAFRFIRAKPPKHPTLICDMLLHLWV